MCNVEVAIFVMASELLGCNWAVCSIVCGERLNTRLCSTFDLILLFVQTIIALFIVVFSVPKSHIEPGPFTQIC